MEESKSQSKKQDIDKIASDYTPDKVANKLISKLLIEKSDGLIGDDYSLSFRTVFRLIILLCLGEIKTVVCRLIGGIIPLIKKSPIFASICYTKIRQLRGSRIKDKEDDRDKNGEDNNFDSLDYNVNIEVNAQFTSALYYYLTDKPGCEFRRSMNKISVANLKEQTTIESISQIRVGNITVVDTINYELSLNTGEPINAHLDIKSTSKPTKYVDLFTGQQRECLIKVIDNAMKVCGIDKLKEQAKVKENCFTEDDITKLLLQNYPHWDYDETLMATSCLSYLCFSISNDSAMSSCEKRLRQGKKIFFDPYHTYQHSLYDGNIYTLIKNQISFTDCGLTKSEIRSVFGDLFSYKFLSDSPAYTDSNSIQTLTIRINGEDSTDSAALIAKQFVSEVCKYQRINAGSTENIKVYCLLTETKETVCELPNPEYEQWLEQKQIIEEAAASSTKDGINSTLIEFLKAGIPPKTIKEINTIKTVTSKLLNEVNKSIDTLYLQENDMRKLLSSLDQFHNKKQMLLSLGLPNKLNILLYGKPGTGKSTTIQAVATYLGRHIYYLDLKNVKSNQDLQKMIEHVNKSVQKGGIIVIEDIDAMTDVVLKRKEIIESRVDQLIGSLESPLSLEYLLNILQGTLTLDDSIFIVTTNHLEHLDPAFYRDGRFDVKIELKLCDHHQMQSIYYKFLNKRIPQDIINNIPENTYSPASVIFHVKDYIFTAETDDQEILAPFIDSSQKSTKL